MFVAESPGDEEMLKGIPLVGATGDEMVRILVEVGLMPRRYLSLLRPKKYSLGDMFDQPQPPSELFFTNVVRLQPFRNEMSHFFHTKTSAKKNNIRPHMGLHPGPEVTQGLILLREEIRRVQPNVIVAMGAASLWALTGITTGKGPGPAGILKWRGSMMDSYIIRDDGKPFKVIPIIHVAAAFRKWEYRYLILHDLRTRVVPEISNPHTHYPQWNFVTRPSYREALALCNDLLRALASTPIAIASDIETIMHRYIACIAFAGSDRAAFCLPFTTITDPSGYWTASQEQALILLVRRIMTHPNAYIIGQNWEYDRQFGLRQWLVKFNLWHDTMTRWHVAFPGLPKALDFISSMVCRQHRYWKDDTKEVDGAIDEDTFWAYNCEDACRTYEADVELDSILTSLNLVKQADRKMALHKPVFRMMNTGVRMNHTARDEIANELIELMFDRQGWFERVVGYNVESKSDKPWYNSPQQTASLFYDWMGVTPVVDKDTKRPTTKADFFPLITSREPLLTPICTALEEYRSLGVFHNVCRATLYDNRIMTAYNIDGAHTLRWSSNKNAFDEGTNLQNISAGTEED